MFARLGNALDRRNSDADAHSHDIVKDRAGPDELALLKPNTPKLVLIGASPLLRQCLSRAFSGSPYFEFSAISSIAAWTLETEFPSGTLIIFFVAGDRKVRDVLAAARAANVMDEDQPFAVLADCEETAEIMAAFECGARAYIPTSVTVEVMIEAIKLVIAGGTYCPTCILQHCGRRPDARLANVENLTPRETAVLKAVRLGLPNKVIAHDLGISESTIKVHVHRIMKKLKVQNRTQVAICGSQLGD
jgi:DNA-binding NarL/FixJ family response regulator